MNTRAPDWWIKALTEVTYGIRKTAVGIADADKWDMPGIKATIERLSGECSPADLARVMVNGADNPKMKTPGGVTAPGPQWADTTRASARQATTCPEHPNTPLTRCSCQHFAGTPKPDNFADLIQAARQNQEDER